MAQSSRRYYVVGDYMVGRQIGAGSFSTVWHARHRIHGTEVAIKEILTARLNPRLQESLKSEIFILKRINHPNIIRLHDMIEDSGKIYIILEYCKGGDLSMYIQQHQRRISEAVAKHFMQQLAEGLKVLRENSLIHRDLKPQNLLLSSKDDNSTLKIADFGFARSLQPRGLAETLCGSPLYMAPEIMQLQKYDAKADLWSVGAILFQLVTGKPPYTGNNQIQLLDNILKSGELQFPPEVGGLSPPCIDLCKKLLRCNPVERLTFEEFFSHPYFFEGHPDDSFRSEQSERVSYQFHPAISTEQSSQDDSLPFTLDDDTTGLDGNAPFARKPSGESTHRFSPGPQSVPVLNLCNLADSSNPRGVLDSMESIDQDYVIVSGTQLGSSASIRSSKASHCPSKFDSHDSRNMNSTSEGLPLTCGATAGVSCKANLEDRLSTAGTSQQGSMDIAGASQQPCADSLRRISSLQHHAAAIVELVKSKLDAGKQLEAFSIQLVILAVWKQALNICYADAASAFDGNRSQESAGLKEASEAECGSDVSEPGGTAGAQDPLGISAKIEREFLHEVERAEELAKAVDPGNLDMPEALELIYQSALELGRHGAVDEYMGEMENAEALYSKAVVLLQFLLEEAPSLILNPPFSLTNSDRYRIQGYVETLLNRQSISRSRRREIFNCEAHSQCPP